MLAMIVVLVLEFILIMLQDVLSLSPVIIQMEAVRVGIWDSLASILVVFVFAIHYQMEAVHKSLTLTI
jgi:hypothetical protein